MSFRIVEMKDLSGAKAHIYSVKFDGYDETLLDRFFNENEDNKNLQEMLHKIIVMATKTGCLKQSLKKARVVLAMVLWHSL